jgi:putative phage-type endonuclease
MIEQGTPEWFELRRGLATGSHFADVMAEGRGKQESTTRRNYRMKLALEIVTGKVIQGSFQGNKHTERGKELEPIARMLYESNTGHIVEEVDFLKHKYLAAGVSPDGLVGDDGLVEFKCPIPAIHWDYLQLNGQPPAEYKWQVYGEMWVAERRWNDFVSYCEDMPEELQLHITRVHWDDKIIAELEAGVSKFMAEVRVTVNEIRDLAKKKAAA